jgi:hypothetical protein
LVINTTKTLSSYKLDSQQLIQPPEKNRNTELNIITMDEYPIGSRVILADLSKVEYNGLQGLVKSGLNQNGRQQVQVSISETEEKKILGLKPTNLKLEPRNVDSLTTREMKTVLSRKDHTGNLTGFDKSELKALVEDYVTSPDEIASILAKAQASTPAPAAAPVVSAGNTNASNIRQQMQNQASQLNNISPDQLRQQAQMMRSMDPNMIRRMNPQMANFTDAQIQMAATQMESMANNPSMVQGMVNQMNNMDDAQLENLSRAQNQFAAGNPNAGANLGVGATATTPAATAAPTPNNIAGGMQNMANMSPEQLQQQATMMKSMSKDALRSMNPLMASWPDSQIDMAIAQMENMANNPEMSKRMMDQMKNMKPEDIEKIQKMAQNGSIPGGAGAQGAAGAPGTGAASPFDPASMSDPMEMLKNTNPAQIKQMLQMVKENPGLFRDMIKASNPAMADQLSDEQISKTMESFASMDEKKIGWIMKALGFAQNVRTFAKQNKVVLIVLVVSILAFVVTRFSSRGGSIDNDVLINQNGMGKDDEVLGSMDIPELDEDEF